MTPWHRIGLFVVLISTVARAQSDVIRLDVDASDAPRKILHCRMSVPVKPGTLRLLYPQWIPGEHGPTGPLNDVVDLKIVGNGKALSWKRDAEHMYAIDVEVPAGTDRIEVTFNYMISGDGSAKLLHLAWNRVLLYPAGVGAADLKYAASLQLPQGWKLGTALPIEKDSEGKTQFATVSLETLVDSPVASGQYLCTHDLTKQPIQHLLHIVGESPESIDVPKDYLAHLAALVGQANALFGAHHYREYHFLLVLSDHVGFGGLEHHESSSNSVDERSVIDEDKQKLWADLLPHEMAHSWNGKYRRPKDIATPDFQEPMKTELLWVYEGLTEYLGQILATRSGLWTEESCRQSIALDAAILGTQGGRKWRPLADTAIAAQLLYDSSRQGRSRRRGTDFYSESALIWLEADAIIRSRTDGKKSLDDFCRRFHGGESGSPRVVPYTFDDVVAALNEVAPNDWRAFLQKRVYEINPNAPVGGIEAAGWKLVYKDEPSEMLEGQQTEYKYTQLSFSLGFTLNEDGAIGDVIPDSPADKAGVAPGMKLVAVNGRKWTGEIIRAAIKAAKTDTTPIELLLENSDFYKTVKIDYHDGERYPDLERDETRPDLLGQIFKPLPTGR
jgi:predicted metalloprotease with PDZ domain